MSPAVDIAAIGYPAVRAAFNDTLNRCAARISEAEKELAEDVLGITEFDPDKPGLAEMLVDTALYSHQSAPVGRAAKRAIDRIAPKLGVRNDRLQQSIAASLPSAIFSVFAMAPGPAADIAIARDLIDRGRTVPIMDQALAALVAERGEILLAGRFLDLGPWHIGFGIVVPLRPSEALAICLACSIENDLDTVRGDLHELVYPVHLHNDDLVMTALQPVIAAIAVQIDAELTDIADVADRFGALLPVKRARADKVTKKGAKAKPTP